MEMRSATFEGRACTACCQVAATVGIGLDRENPRKSPVRLLDEGVDDAAVMGAGIEKGLILTQDGKDFRDEKAHAIGNGCRIEGPFLPETPPGDELQVMGARGVIVPAFKHILGMGKADRIERTGKPAVRQRMPVAKTLGKIVERNDILPAVGEKIGLQRSIGAGGDADGKKAVCLDGGRHVLGLGQYHTLPGGVRAECVGLPVHDHGEIQADEAKMVTRQPSHIAGTIKHQRPARCLRRKGAGAIVERVEQSHSLRRVGQHGQSARGMGVACALRAGSARRSLFLRTCHFSPVFGLIRSSSILTRFGPVPMQLVLTAPNRPDLSRSLPRSRS